MSNIHWYVDASHQTHDDCLGHTGALLTFSHGATVSSSNKQKLNTKISTETEIVGLYDKTGDILWTCNFLEAQGYTISTNFFYQDNMSTLSIFSQEWPGFQLKTHQAHQSEILLCQTLSSLGWHHSYLLPNRPQVGGYFNQTSPRFRFLYYEGISHELPRKLQRGPGVYFSTDPAFYSAEALNPSDHSFAARVC